MWFNIVNNKYISNIPFSVKFYKTLLIGILSVHAVFLAFFIYLRITPLIIYNILSCTLYFSLTFLLKHSKYDLIIVLSYIEIALYFIVSSLTVGWGCGTYLYIFAMMSSIFFMPLKSSKITYTITSSFIFVLFVTKLISDVIDIFPTYYISYRNTQILFTTNCVIAIVPIVAFSAFFNNIYNSSRNNLYEKNRRLSHLANVDPLTGLANRRFMSTELDKSAHMRKRDGTPFCLMILDIDDFKRINDTYGHDCGDYVLKCISNFLMDSVKQSDTVCRWGGEEILISFNDIVPENCSKAAERIRSGIENLGITYRSANVLVTVTVGISYSNQSIQEMLLEADNNLYYGKKHGKNCVICTEDCHC